MVTRTPQPTVNIYIGIPKNVAMGQDATMVLIGFIQPWTSC